MTRPLLFSLLLFTAVLSARAQTNSADTSAPATTNAPAEITPAVPDANSPAHAPFDPNTPVPAPAPPQVNPPNSPGNAPSQEEIIDIRPPFFFLRSWFWLWIALASAAAAALLTLIWTWLKPHRQLSAKSAYDLALEKLEKARSMMSEENPMPYAVLVSETVRSYLGQRFQTPSTRRTTEEFLRMMEDDPTTPLAEHRDLLRNFLQSCDLVKFARYQPTLAELEEVQQHAVSFVTATKPAPGPSHGRSP